MVLVMNIDYQQYRRPSIVFTFLGLTTLVAGGRVCLPRLAQHAPLDQARPAVVPAFRARQARHHSLSRIFPRVALATDLRLEACAACRRPRPACCSRLLIVKEPDLGTAVACMAITASVLYIAGMRMRYLMYGFAASLLPLYILIVRVPWRWHRIIAFLDPWKDPQGHGFHIIQSMIAVSTGGLTGAGLMEGKQKLFYLPEPHTDFIYANVAEELGLWGAVLVVILFSIFLWRGIRVAMKTQDPFARFLATGITAMVVVQALINISVVLGMMPTKGIPLPFISYGGSSLFITLASVGVLLNITQQNN